MKQRTRVIITIVAIVLLVAGGIWYGKQQLWKAQPADAIAIRQKERHALDLRPAAIAKLQQLVKNGSDSLYKLRIDSLLPDVGTGTIVLRGVGLYPDSDEMQRLPRLQQLPDDVFRIELSSLRVSGISLADIVNRRDMHIRAMEGLKPQVIVYHKPQPYNADKRMAAKRKTIYERVKGQIDRLAIDSVSLKNGIVIDYNKDVKNTFKEVDLLLNNILIDAAAEKDPGRFLFAKHMQLKAGSINMPVGNSSYDLNMGGVSISGGRQEVIVRDLALLPRGGKEAFAGRQQERSSIFTIKAPELKLKGANWWAVVHGEALVAEEAEVSKASVNVYVDKRIPPGPGVKRDNFPQQKLMEVKMPVSVKRVRIKNADLAYEEFNDKTRQRGSIVFGSLDMTAEGVTNLPGEVAKQPTAQVHSTCRFMNATPMQAHFALDLPKSRRGAFKADITVGSLSHEVVNTFSEAMGLTRFTSGAMQSAKAYLKGNNDRISGKVSIRYSNLHLEPLKPEGDEDGRLKGRKVQKKIANIVFVKDNNPSRGELREPEFALARTTEGNFFNFSWAGVRLGLLKTLGIPPALGARKKK